MIEVFKTNVTSSTHALVLVGLIHEAFPGSRANFDLQDCDRILRVVGAAGAVPTEGVVRLLRTHGFRAEPLPDDDPPSRPNAEALSSTELTLLGPFRGWRTLRVVEDYTDR